MIDETEAERRRWAANINSSPRSRDDLEAEYGQVWDSSQLTADYEVIGFGSPLVVVRRKADGVRGSLVFQHEPRLYFCFEAG